MSSTNTHAGINPRSLFIASCIALIATAMSFAIRGDIITSLGIEFSLSKENMGWILGAGFWGFTLAMIFGGPLCDALGMKMIMILAFLAHLLGTAATIFAPGFTVLFLATLCVSLGNGLVEAAINPLVATIYSDNKTHKLNVLHAWFPGGIIIGGVATFLLTITLGPKPDVLLSAAETIKSGVGAVAEAQKVLDWDSVTWKIKMALMFIPTIIYGYLVFKDNFPQTERVQSGVSTKSMFMEALRPMFLVWVFCMLLTASTELGPNGWITDLLKNLLPAGRAEYSILILVWISGVMFVLRSMAGQVVHRITPMALLTVSALLACIGLLWLSNVHTLTTAFAAATIFAVGVCYFWPTMLGVTSERFPKGGALLLGIMGGAGNLAVGLVLGLMGKVADVSGTGSSSFLAVAVLPAILVVIFGALYLKDRATGGYKVVKLDDRKK